jgi:hypothetical protein
MDSQTRLYTQRDLLELTGAKRSQIENFVRSGVLSPHVAGSGTGVARVYTFEGVVACEMAVRLAPCRMTAPAIALVVKALLALEEECLAPPRRRRSWVELPPGFFEEWRTFLDPDRRSPFAGATFFYSPESGEFSIEVDNFRRPDSETFVAVDLAKLIKRLEDKTGDRWPPPITRRPIRRSSRGQ